MKVVPYGSLLATKTPVTRSENGDILQASSGKFGVAEKDPEFAMKELTFARDRYAAGLATSIEVTSARTPVACARRIRSKRCSASMHRAPIQPRRKGK
jgi:hypothetical protein